MEKKEEMICDFTTGICGSADARDGIMEFVDLTVVEEKEDVEEEK